MCFNHKNYFKIFISLLCWFILVTWFFNKYAYDIFEFNSNLRVLIKERKISQREFDKNGLAISYSSKIGTYQSPFYIVHYAILYSDRIKPNNKSLNHYIWRQDPSIDFWNVKPDDLSNELAKKYFKNSVDWLVDNVDYSLNGQAHYLYKFDWPYMGFPRNKLQRNWWSGLTDAYAIIPLLRAYELYNDEKYLKVAQKLYHSSLTKYEEYGSLTYLNGHLWIEEYIDQNIVPQKELPYVLNGMIYATFGIQAYESLNLADSKRISKELLQSIVHNIDQYNYHGWSHYDLYKQGNNIKYHLIHASLLDYLIKNDFRSYHLEYESIEGINSSWRNSANNPGAFYVLYGNKTFAYYQFILSYFVIVFLGVILIIIRGKIFRIGKK